MRPDNNGKNKSAAQPGESQTKSLGNTEIHGRGITDKPTRLAGDKGLSHTAEGADETHVRGRQGKKRADWLRHDGERTRTEKSNKTQVKETNTRQEERCDQ